MGLNGPRHDWLGRQARPFATGGLYLGATSMAGYRTHEKQGMVHPQTGEVDACGA